MFVIPGTSFVPSQKAVLSMRLSTWAMVAIAEKGFWDKRNPNTGALRAWSLCKICVPLRLDNVCLDQRAEEPPAKKLRQ